MPDVGGAPTPIAAIFCPPAPHSTFSPGTVPAVWFSIFRYNECSSTLNSSSFIDHGSSYDGPGQWLQDIYLPARTCRRPPRTDYNLTWEKESYSLMNRGWPHCCQALAGLELKNACWQLDYDPYNNKPFKAPVPWPILQLFLVLFCAVGWNQLCLSPYIYTQLSWFEQLTNTAACCFLSVNICIAKRLDISCALLLIGTLALNSRVLTSEAHNWLCLHLTLCDLIAINPLSWVPFQLRDLPLQDHYYISFSREKKDWDVTFYKAAYPSARFQWWSSWNVAYCSLGV